MANKDKQKKVKKKADYYRMVECNGDPKDEMRFLGGKKGKSRKVRCSDCNMRFETSWFDCHDGGWSPCWHEKFPPHKKRKKIR